MIFRQLFDHETYTFTYLIGDKASGEAILIDPVFEQYQRDLALIEELGLKLKYVFDTHCHADHITGAWLLRDESKCQYALAKACGAKHVDIELEDGHKLSVGSLDINVLATPGHTSGCVSYLIDKMLFTGDCLLIRSCGRTDFQSGSPETLYHSIKEKIFTLPDDTIIYPGHDYSGRLQSTVAEEKAHNPRIGGKANLSDFVGYMNNLNLPHPKKIASALPANLLSGKPPKEFSAHNPTWAPIKYSYAGIPQIEPHWVAEHLQDLQIVDVRTQDELQEQGYIKGSMHIPLDDLLDQIDQLDPERSTVLVCRSGRRSSQGVVLLKKKGFKKLANVKNGMLHWLDLSLPVAI